MSTRELLVLWGTIWIASCVLSDAARNFGLFIGAAACKASWFLP